MKKVLITLDYDYTSHKVAETGVNLAKAMNAEIILLHVISNPVFYCTEYSGTMEAFLKRNKVGSTTGNNSSFGTSIEFCRKLWTKF